MTLRQLSTKLPKAPGMPYSTFMNETKTKVYVIEVRGNDYYDQLEFFGVYADKFKAEHVANELRCKVEDNDDACEDGELLYEEVVVSEVTLN